MNLEEATKYMKSKVKEKYKDGMVQLAVLHDEEANDFFKEAENYKRLEIWLEELLEYRETELTPDKIREMDKLYLEKCQEVNSLVAACEKLEGRKQYESK